MYKKLLLLSFLFLSAFTLKAQFGNFEQPVKWSIDSKKTSDSTAQIILNAKVDKDWYIYSQKTKDGGPIPLNFTYEKNEAFDLIGKTEENAEKEKAMYEEAFEMDVVKLFGDSQFTQSIKVKNIEDVVKGSLTFQTCKDVCLPPETIPFAVRLKDLKSVIGEKEVATLLGQAISEVPVKKGLWPNYGTPVSDCRNDATATSAADSSTNWGIFLLGVLGGLVALLTPCVFPMIPLTVTFFTKRHEKKARGVFEAILYGLSIFLIYFLLALPFLIFKLPKDTLYRISTSPALNLSFFAIFMFFAFSLFGYYELTLPSKWANKTDSASNKGGLIGIFFMAITLAIVSFSCTGPILGSLMAGTIATEGGQLKLVYGMSGFGVALGFPFAIFAMFPGILKKLPKSGSWMNTIKVVLAFVEVALALKFLSNADLVQQWGIIKYEVFLAIWFLVALGLALYLFGIIRFPHDSKNQKINLTRKGLGLASLVFAGYVASGFFGNNLNALSGFPPPKHYSFFKKKEKDDLHSNSVLSLEEGVKLAKEQNKPMLLDFTGWTCVNCRKVEQNIWTDEIVASRLKNDVVLVSLYADDSGKIPENDQYYSENLQKTVNSIGEKWTDFEATSFGKISQPLYAIVTPDGELMNSPIAYTSSIQDYLDFLDCGIFAHKNDLELDEEQQPDEKK